MGYQAHCIVMEELSRASASIALSYAAHSQLCINQLSLHGTPTQKQEYLPRLISGEHVGALAMSEADAGSDVVSMRSTASKTEGPDGEGEMYEVNGSKLWITNGAIADTLILYAKTDPAAKSKGITAFIVPTRPHPPTEPPQPHAQRTHTPGFTAPRPSIPKLGMRGSPTAELSFSNLPLHSSQILGPLNGGTRVLMQGLDLERLVLAAGPVGIARRALDEALPYVHERKQFGTPIVKQQLVRGRIADMYARTRAAQSLVMSVARAVDNMAVTDTRDAGGDSGLGAGISRDCTAAILYAAEAGTRTALEGVQLLGGMGYVDGEEGVAPVGRLVRDAKLYEIGAGTSEVRRVVVGRSWEGEFLRGR